MASVDKSVFVSYRRPNLMGALAISQKLSAHGYDVYFDHGNSGGEAVNLDQIRKRPHFLVLLTPTALVPFDDPNDPMRREFETALDGKHNIVVLLYEGTNLNHPSLTQRLTGKLADLLHYPNISVSKDHFDKTIQTVCDQYLSAPINSAWTSAPREQIENKLQEDAVEIIKNALLEKPTLTVQEWFECADKANNWEEKIRCYTEALRLQPDLSIAYNNRGDARCEMGDLNGAIQDFTRAIALDPTNPSFFINRAGAFLADHNFQAALDDCNEAIRLQPDLADAYNNRGNVLTDLGNFDKAIADFTTAIQLKSKIAPYFYNRGLAYHRKGDLYQAALNYIEAIRLQPDHYGAYNNRAAIRFAAGDMDGAIRDYSTVLQINPGYIMAYKDRARAYLVKRDYTSAKADLQKFVDLGGTLGGEQNEVERIISSLRPTNEL